MKVCTMCNGSGHDRSSRPVIEFTDYIDDEGKRRRRHVTKAIGSGCMKCHGKVYIPLKGSVRMS